MAATRLRATASIFSTTRPLECVLPNLAPGLTANTFQVYAGSAGGIGSQKTGTDVSYQVAVPATPSSTGGSDNSGSNGGTVNSGNFNPNQNNPPPPDTTPLQVYTLQGDIITLSFEGQNPCSPNYQLNPCVNGATCNFVQGRSNHSTDLSLPAQSTLTCTCPPNFYGQRSKIQREVHG